MLPCMRATMGDWVYYVALMPFTEIADRVKPAQEIHAHSGLRDLLQRALTNRSEAIADYLLHQKQHFFNAIILGIYEGDPQWLQIDVSGNEFVDDGELTDFVKESVGIISLSGGEKIFAIDGQHRVEGIKTAIERRNKISNEEQTVIFVAHKNTVYGKQRTRRLFSSLNRYAKPVTLAEIIALDEDDVVAIVTRNLLETHPVLQKEGVIHVSKNKTVRRTNTSCITSIHALYECLDTILTNMPKRKWTVYKKIRPSDDDLNYYLSEAAQFWDLLLKYFAPIRKYEGENINDLAMPYRNNNGGHLIFRPVGLCSITRAIKILVDNGMPMQRAIRKIARFVPMDLKHDVWSGLLWEAGKKRIITLKTNENIAVKLMILMCGVDPDKHGFLESQLRIDYCSAINQEVDSVTWPPSK